MLPLLIQGQPCNCNLNNKNGALYFAYGYNFDWFSKSDIHFKGKNNQYDFSIYNARAIDRDGTDNFFHNDLTIPQYSFRIGYFFNNKKNTGIELNYDHVKYVVVQNQRVHIKGNVNGTYVDTDTVLTRKFIEFEHTNGANFCIINMMKRHTLLKSENKRYWLSYIVKGGIGFLYPRSDVTLFGKRRNDKYHVAGYVAGIDSGLRFDFLKNFFVETSLKGSFANYLNVRLPYGGKGHHHFFALEYIATLGLQVGM